jgi:hypothetical protein
VNREIGDFEEKARVHSLNHFSGGDGLIFLGRSFGKSFFVLLWRRVLTVKFRQPSHEFTFGVGMSFVSYPLVLTPVV